MKIAHTLDELNNISTPSIVTVGNFDGVHCGHQMILSSVITRAKQKGARSVAITFDPHPAHVLHSRNRLPLITPITEKLTLLATTGIDLTLILPFHDFRQWTAHQFAKSVLADALHGVEVYEGETFRFGYNAEAGIVDLEQLGRELGFTVHACKPFFQRGAPVSSSRIRKLIAAGRLSEARVLLGRSFSIRSTPASGRGYGTLYTVPTINLAPYTELLPADGVYVSTLKVEDRLFRGVTNAGNRPTFGVDSFAVETHLFGFDPIPLKEFTPIELTFLYRLRAERRFPAPEDLRAQIDDDIHRAERYFALSDMLRQA